MVFILFATLIRKVYILLFILTKRLGKDIIFAQFIISTLFFQIRKLNLLVVWLVRTLQLILWRRNTNDVCLMLIRIWSVAFVECVINDLCRKALFLCEIVENVRYRRFLCVKVTLVIWTTFMSRPVTLSTFGCFSLFSF